MKRDLKKVVTEFNSSLSGEVVFQDDEYEKYCEYSLTSIVWWMYDEYESWYDLDYCCN